MRKKFYEHVPNYALWLSWFMLGCAPLVADILLRNGIEKEWTLVGAGAWLIIAIQIIVAAVFWKEVDRLNGIITRLRDKSRKQFVHEDEDGALFILSEDVPEVIEFLYELQGKEEKA